MAALSCVAHKLTKNFVFQQPVRIGHRVALETDRSAIGCRQIAECAAPGEHGRAWGQPCLACQRQGMPYRTLPGEKLAVIEILTAPLRHPCLLTLEKALGTWCEAGRSALVTHGQCLHTAVQSGNLAEDNALHQRCLQSVR